MSKPSKPPSGPQRLADLLPGRTVEGDSGSDPRAPPPWLNPSVYARIRPWFEQRALTVALFWHASLVIGFSLKPLLEALVFTDASGTPQQALSRYADTFAHLIDWHLGDVFDPAAAAFRSVADVRSAHAGVRAAMEKQGKRFAISQFDTAVVQTGFMGALTVAPSALGLVATDEELAQYVFFWRCVGRQLGVADEYNLCGGGRAAADRIVNEITQTMLFPAMRNPPSNYWLMSESYIAGLNSIWGGVPLLSVRSTLAVTYWALGQTAERPFELSLADSLRFFGLYRVLFLLLARAPAFERAASALLLLVFRLRPPPSAAIACSCPFSATAAAAGPAELRPSPAQGFRACAARGALLVFLLGSVLLFWAAIVAAAVAACSRMASWQAMQT